MERAHLFIVGSILVIIAAVISVIGVARIQTPQNTESPNDTGRYATFSGTTNVFESLRSREDDIPGVIRAQNTLTPTSHEQHIAIENIIRAWETRPGSSDAREARTHTQTAEHSVQKTAEQIERDEITALFNDLIGTRITDKLTQTNTTGASNDDIWLGGYNDTQASQETSTISQTQHTLRTYGNELAAILKSFNLTHGDQPNMLEAFLKNRSNTTALKRLTDGYIQLSSDISQLQAPAQLTKVHDGLVASYTSVGELLWNITLADNDEELVERMLIYNTSSEEVAKNHITLITLFKAHGVIFESHEPGHIFMFSPPTQN